MSAVDTEKSGTVVRIFVPGNASEGRLMDILSAESCRARGSERDAWDWTGLLVFAVLISLRFYASFVTILARLFRYANPGNETRPQNLTCGCWTWKVFSLRWDCPANNKKCESILIRHIKTIQASLRKTPDHLTCSSALEMKHQNHAFHFW